MTTQQVKLNPHSEYGNDGTTLPWPAADGSTLFSGVALPPLVVSPGDIILGNRSPDTTLVSASGSTTLVFGTALQAGAFTGTGSNNSAAHPYSGPYLSIAPSAIDRSDPAFEDVIRLGTVSRVYDPNSKVYPIDWEWGERQVSGLSILPEAVHYPQLSKAHHSRGHFAGGSFQFGAAGGTLLFVGLNPSVTPDTFYFVTDDGSGDVGTNGRYRIFGPGGTPPTRIVVGPAGAAGYGFNFSVASPANHIITFAPFFPAGPTAASTPGSLVAGTTYDVRYCLTKVVAGVTVESALSPVLAVSGATGYVFSVSALPHGWTGARLYYGTHGADQENIFPTQVYDPVAGTITWITTAGDTFILPSYGFQAWDPGTIISNVGLMKVGHLSGTKDAATQTWTFSSFMAGAAQHTPVNHAPQSITGGQSIAGVPMPNHLTPSSVHYSHLQSYTTTTGTTPIAAGSVAQTDGAGGVTYGVITLGMLATGSVSGSAIVNASVTSVKLGFLANSAFSLDVTSGDTGSGSVNVSSWVTNTWYHFSVTHSSVGIKTFQQVLCAMTTDHSGESGYGDDGPVTWFRNSGGVYSDSTAHVPTGTPAQPMLIASVSDYGEVVLTSAWTDGSQLTVTGWGRVTASGSTKLTLRITLQGALQ